jgi:hypothetical protein
MMKKNTFAFFIPVFLLAVSSPIFAAPPAPIELPMELCLAPIKVTGNTPEECRKSSEAYDSDKYAHCTNTAWMTDLAGKTRDCQQGAVNRLLDQRLLKLKQENPGQFQKEMTLQKDFNEAVKTHCDQMRRCEGFMYNYLIPSCYSNLYEYRGKQADSINRGSLEIPTTSGIKKRHWGKPFEPFAVGLCGMPPEVWKGGKPPEDCKERVLMGIEKRVGHEKGNICL